MSSRRREMMGTFRDTMPNMELKSRAVYDYTKSRPDMRDTMRRPKTAGPVLAGASARRTAPDPQQLILEAASITSRATLHRTTKPNPETRKLRRSKTNENIFQSARQERARVLLLSQAQRSADLENSALIKTRDSLQKALETPERVLWVADQSLHRRQQRPLGADDEASELLRAELRAAKAVRKDLQQHLAGVRRHLVEMKKGREAIAAEIKRCKQGLDLTADTYSGAVMDFPAPTEDSPPCFYDMRALYEQSQAMREGIAVLIERCNATLARCRADVDASLDAESSRLRTTKNRLAKARGQVQVAANATQRDAHLTMVRRERNEGPAEGGKWLTTAERHDRPLVTRYSRADGVSAAGLTAEERAADSYHSFSRTLTTAQADATQIASTAAKLDAAIHNHKKSEEIDREVRRMRSRLAPPKRALWH